MTSDEAILLAQSLMRQIRITDLHDEDRFQGAVLTLSGQLRAAFLRGVAQHPSKQMTDQQTKLLAALERYSAAEEELFALLPDYNGPFPFEQSSCPLGTGPDHYSSTANMFGGGAYAWICLFCGKEDED